jgi:hypothetical protein
MAGTVEKIALKCALFLQFYNQSKQSPIGENSPTLVTLMAGFDLTTHMYLAPVSSVAGGDVYHYTYISFVDQH